jgi:hypothetical protein
MHPTKTIKIQAKEVDRSVLPAHMSIGAEYEVERSSTSGARYHRVETLNY